jgi:uncharacterized DUF497 family protein
MKKARFEWDEDKDRENQIKHKVSFSLAQRAFLDPRRIIAEDESHSGVGDIENGPKTDILGQAGEGIRTHRCLDFPA